MASLPKARTGTSAPPYLPFARFLESLDSIATCLPRQISSATWKSESSYIASLLASAYSFLGLADPNGIPTPLLHRLVSDRASRPEILRELLRAAYGEVLDAVQKAESPEAVDHALARFRLSGATHRKAASFITQACRYAGLHVAPFTAARSRISHAKAGRGIRERVDQATTTTVQLQSGGALTLVGRFNPFTISAEDRKFVFKLVDELSEYQAASRRPVESDSVTEDEVPF